MPAEVMDERKELLEGRAQTVSAERTFPRCSGSTLGKRLSTCTWARWA